MQNAKDIWSREMKRMFSKAFAAAWLLALAFWLLLVVSILWGDGTIILKPIRKQINIKEWCPRAYFGDASQIAKKDLLVHGGSLVEIAGGAFDARILLEDIHELLEMAKAVALDGGDAFGAILLSEAYEEGKFGVPVDRERSEQVRYLLGRDGLEYDFWVDSYTQCEDVYIMSEIYKQMGHGNNAKQIMWSRRQLLFMNIERFVLNHFKLVAASGFIVGIIPIIWFWYARGKKRLRCLAA